MAKKANLLAEGGEFHEKIDSRLKGGLKTAQKHYPSCLGQHCFHNIIGCCV